MKNLQITIFGLGYIGLPTAALFAKRKINVIGVARNKERIGMINEGKSPIVEAGLNELVHNTVKSGYLSATDNGKDAIKNSNIMIVIVPTPMDEYNRADLTAVKSTCEIISHGLKKDDMVIIESTVPQGTCQNIIIPILENSGLKAGLDFGIAYTPERALPNNTIYEMTHNARVIGGINDASANNAVSLYKKITYGEIIKVKNLITAETVKLIENTYRDTNIALANEIAMICGGLGVDAIEAIKAANHHPRVNILTPGPGVGGHCLAIDPYFIVEMAEQNGLEAPLIRTARITNEGMPKHVTKLIKDGLKENGKSVENSDIGILGVAYKGNVPDARETPAEPLIKNLIEMGAKISANDPYAPKDVIESFGALSVDMKQIFECDCVVLLTDHDLYKEITPNMIKNKVFVCTRPILDPGKFRENGVIFKGVGRV
jgi:UDP-N-acetyl-D-mannosaminuronic acid dehydrogenase